MSGDDQNSKPKVSASDKARQAALKRRAIEKKSRPKSSFDYNFYIIILLALVLAWSAVFYKFIQPPPSLPIGQVSASRIKLEDGRFVAISEKGANSDNAKHNVLILHDIRGSRLDLLPNVTQEELVNLGIRLVSYDRPGYGQSDPNPKRTAKTEVEDITEIAEKVGFGTSFHLVGVSWGALPAYAALEYIPEKIQGVALINPILDYWAPTISDMETYESWMWMVNTDRIVLLLARYVPGFLHFWMTQKVIKLGVWGGITQPNLTFVAEADKEILSWTSVQEAIAESRSEVVRQGPAESVYRDLKLGFQSWPFEIEKLKLEGEDSQFQGDVHIYQGSDDWVSPAPANKFVTRVQPTVSFTEVEKGGHFFYYEKGWSLRILKDLVGISDTEKTCSLEIGADGSCSAGR